ncbi:fluoride efflux transporter FluC [Metabacillus sp. 113a]|uniref:fluoride efflux transporter FluC n=1 Tax=Metabacillus sp. 113a TaxID=3404706 RepID=UPI003CF486C1
MIYLYIAAGGFLGAAARAAISKKMNRKTFPFGTLLVNWLGSIILGCMTGAEIAGHASFFAAAGFLGSFTTFSTLNLELWMQRESKKIKVFLLYAAASYIGGISLAFVGYWVGKGL